MKMEHARNLLVRLALDGICSEDDFSDFYRYAYYVIAKLGLQRKAEEEQLFEGKELLNPHYREYLVKRLKDFLIKYIR